MALRRRFAAASPLRLDREPSSGAFQVPSYPESPALLTQVQQQMEKGSQPYVKRPAGPAAGK